MILKVLPLLMIIIPVISLFVDENVMFNNKENMTWIKNFVYTLYILPWYFKIISITLGIVILNLNKK
jgi:hypothetical protein